MKMGGLKSVNQTPLNTLADDSWLGYAKC